MQRAGGRGAASRCPTRARSGRPSTSASAHREQHHQRAARSAASRWKNASTCWLERELRRHHALHQLACGLHGALRPAELLRAERAHVLRELGGRDDVLAIDEAPARHLRAVRRDRDPRSACRAASRRSARSHSRRHMPAVPEKLKSHPAAARARFSTRWWPSSMSALDAREPRHVAVHVAPARLHHADLRRSEEVGTSRGRNVSSGRKSASKIATNLAASLCARSRARRPCNPVRSTRWMSDARRAP